MSYEIFYFGKPNRGGVQLNNFTFLELEALNDEEGVARLCFTDNHKAPIGIPTGIQVLQYDEEAREYIQVPPRDNQYLLFWTKRYQVDFDSKRLLTLGADKIWEIQHHYCLG